MDFLEQPRWITSSGNTIDIGTPGPENSVLIGGGNETNPMWEQSTQAGEILQNVGGNQVMWRQPIITELNGGSIYGASIYAPSSSGNRDDVLVSNASGEPFWRAPLITSLNGNGWSFDNNNYSIRGSGIYAPTSGGTSGDALYSNGSGAPVWRDTYRCVISKPSSVPIYSKGGSAWNQGAYTLLGDAGLDSVDIDWYKGNTLAFRERQVRVSGSFSSDFWFRVPTGLANSNNYNITNATMLPLRSSISGGGVTFCAHHKGADSRYVYFGVDSGTTEDGACFIISIKNTAIIN